MPGEAWPPKVVTKRFPVGSGFQELVIEQETYTYSSRSSPFYPSIIQQNPANISRVKLTNIPWQKSASTTWLYPQPVNLLNSKFYKGLYDKGLAELDRKTFSEISSRKMELGLLLMERAKTADLIRSTAVEAEKLVRKYGAPQERIKRALKKKKPYSKKARSLNHKLASMQLAFSYGWAPLAQELYALATQFGKGDLVGYIKTPYTTRGTGFGENSTARTDWNVTIYYNYFLVVRVSDPMLLLASEFGLTNPATVAWEMTPWSFAIDWVLPIGDFLQQFDATMGLEIVVPESSRTIGVRYTSSVKFLEWTGRGGSAFEEHRSLQRDLGKTPSFRFPPIRNPISSFRRALNQISLLASLGIKR